MQIYPLINIWFLTFLFIYIFCFLVRKVPQNERLSVCAVAVWRDTAFATASKWNCCEIIRRRNRHQSHPLLIDFLQFWNERKDINRCKGAESWCDRLSVDASFAATTSRGGLTYSMAASEPPQSHRHVVK